MFELFPTERLKMSVSDFSVSTASKTSMPDWLADEFQAMLDELATRNIDHSPVLVDCVGDTRFAICATCEQNIESWWQDGDDDRSAMWGAWGVRIEFSNGATLEKICKG